MKDSEVMKSNLKSLSFNTSRNDLLDSASLIQTKNIDKF